MKLSTTLILTAAIAASSACMKQMTPGAMGGSSTLSWPTDKDGKPLGDKLVLFVYQDKAELETAFSAAAIPAAQDGKIIPLAYSKEVTIQIPSGTYFFAGKLMSGDKVYAQSKDEASSKCNFVNKASGGEIPLVLCTASGTVSTGKTTISPTVVDDDYSTYGSIFITPMKILAPISADAKDLECMLGVEDNIKLKKTGANQYELGEDFIGAGNCSPYFKKGVAVQIDDESLVKVQ